MFESTQIPPGWRDVLNTLDAVIVPSDFCAGVFRDCGVKTPIHVQPLGISRAFRPVPRPTDRTPYTFLALGDRGMRKGWHIAGQAFMRAFGDDLNYRLIYKARPHSLERLRGFTNPNIELRRADLPDTKLAALYAETDCFLFPSSGEGQGLPPLEYAATAGPVIATHWGGMADHLPQWGYPINYTLKPAWGSDPVMGGLGMWAEPDIDDLAATMTFVASHRTWALERAAEAATFVRRHYTWRKFARKVFAVWQEVTEHGKRSVWAAVPYRTG